MAFNLPIPVSQTPPGPGEHAFAITPEDATPLAQATRYIYVGGAGDLTVVMNGDTAPVTFKAVPVGTTLAISVSQVNATNTTATHLLGIY